MSTYTGDMIRKYRTEKGLTQKKLGELCGIADSAIRRYEAGNANPKIETLQKIADALDVPVAYLLEGFLGSNLEEYKKTREWKKSVQFDSSYYGVIKILEYIYDSVEEKELEDIGYYYLIENNNETFILFDDDIEYIVDFLENSLPFLIDAMKKTESEEEIINEIRKEIRESQRITSEENTNNSEE